MSDAIEDIRRWRNELVITPEIEGGIQHSWSRDVDVLLKEVDRLAEAEAILRKMLDNEPYDAPYFDIEAGIIDGHVSFTPGEQEYLRALRDQVDAARDHRTPDAQQPPAGTGG